MPLSGPHGEEGTKLAELIKWGIEDHLHGLLSTTTYDVATKDSTDQAIEKLKNSNTQIILGPLFSPTVKSLESLVKERNMVVITLSNNALLADDNSIFIFGHAPLKQTNRLLNYLFAHGYKDFAILTPASQAGINLSRALTEIISSHNQSVVISEQYVNSPESMDIAIHKISDKADEIIEDIDNEFKPVLILSEENKDSLKSLFELLQKYNLDEKSVIVGDGRIDGDFTDVMHYLYTGSSIENSSIFVKAKQELGIERMNYLENLAYDLGSFSAIAIGENYTKETFLNRLKSPVWYKGFSGDFRFASPVVERKYSIIEKDHNVYKIIDRPASSLKKE